MDRSPTDTNAHAIAPPAKIGRGQILVLVAALLGWMFDGLEMGLFPLVARPALKELLSKGTELAAVTNIDGQVGLWFNIITAGFLVGAATGGVLFGWLGDRIGRVRAMTLSVLCYALFTGLCGLATSATQILCFRFVASLGMGGEWALGVALVMEIWGGRSRALLAGLIGAAANVGYLLIALVGLGLNHGFVTEFLANTLHSLGTPATWTEGLLANSAWRLLMLLGATPAVLTLLIRLFVPESESWEKGHKAGATSHWATRDLLAVLVGALGPGAMIYVWATDWHWSVRLIVTLLGLVIATLGYLYPVVRYLQREQIAAGPKAQDWRPTVGRMLLGAGLASVALLATWGTVQQLPLLADKMAEKATVPQPDSNTPPLDPKAAKDAKAFTQVSSSIGAIFGTMVGAMLGSLLGRRLTYSILCMAAMGSVILVFQGSSGYTNFFLFTVFLAGFCSASFYGWLPLYLPELFRTQVRATGQGFAFNFGRIVAAIGTLQIGNLIKYYEGDYVWPCTLFSLIYLVGLPLIFFAPETKGKPLPE